MTAGACMLALQVARTSAGVYVSSRLSGRESEADEEDAEPCLEVENLLCVTVDACGRHTSGFVNAHFRYSRAALGSEDEDADDDLEDGSDDDPETHSLEVVSSAQYLRDFLARSLEPLRIRPVVSVGCTACQLLRCRHYRPEGSQEVFLCAAGQLPGLAATCWCCKIGLPSHLLLNAVTLL